MEPDIEADTQDEMDLPYKWDLEPPQLTQRFFMITVGNVFKWKSPKDQRRRLLSAVEFVSLITYMDENEGLEFLAGVNILPSFLTFIAKLTEAFTEFQPRSKHRSAIIAAARILSSHIVFFFQHLLDRNRKRKFSELVYPLASFYYYHYVLDPGTVPEISDVLCSDPWNFIIRAANNSRNAQIVQLIQQDTIEAAPGQQAEKRKRLLPEIMETEPLQVLGSKIKALGLDIYDMRIYTDDTLALKPKRQRSDGSLDWLSNVDSGHSRG